MGNLSNSTSAMVLRSPSESQSQGECIRYERLKSSENAVVQGNAELGPAAAERGDDPVGDVLRPDDQALHRSGEPRLRKALRLDEAGLDRDHADTPPPQRRGGRPRERELGVLRRRVRAGGRKGDLAG